MPGEDVAELRREVGRQPVGDVDRAVLTAGAADRDRKIAAVGALVLGYPLVEKSRDVVDHPLHGGVRLEKGDHLRVPTGLRAQGRLPVGVRERAHVEYEVRIARDAVLEA